MSIREIKNRIDNALENRLHQVATDARFRPVIDQVKAAHHDGTTSSELLDVAVKATRDEYKRSNRPVDADKLREDAFLATAAAAAESDLQLADLPQGGDKTEHFFMSGLISLKATSIFDKVMPRAWAEKLGTAASVAVGYAKEVGDKFFGTGFDRDDIKADKAGAKRPFEIKVSE
jgi:hypothetical protein